MHGHGETNVPILLQISLAQSTELDDEAIMYERLNAELRDMQQSANNCSCQPVEVGYMLWREHGKRVYLGPSGGSEHHSNITLN